MSTDTLINPLKPCPFCGEKAQMQTDGEQGYWIECASTACGASTNIRIALMDDVQPMLVDHWNHRAPVNTEDHPLAGPADRLLKEAKALRLIYNPPYQAERWSGDAIAKSLYSGMLSTALKVYAVALGTAPMPAASAFESGQFAALLAAALRLDARGHFAPSTCADHDTNADMAAMRAALTCIQGQ
jgi:hypothetical protein